MPIGLEADVSKIRDMSDVIESSLRSFEVGDELQHAYDLSVMHVFLAVKSIGFSLGVPKDKLFVIADRVYDVLYNEISGALD